LSPAYLPEEFVSEKNLTETQETRSELMSTLASSRFTRLLRNLLIQGGPVIALLLLAL